MHDNECTEHECLFGMNLVVLKYDHTYTFVLHHLLPSILCLAMNTQKVSDTPMMIQSFQTIATIATILTHFLLSSTNINSMHGNDCTEGECLFQMKGVLPNHCNDYNQFPHFVITLYVSLMIQEPH